MNKFELVKRLIPVASPRKPRRWYHVLIERIQSVVRLVPADCEWTYFPSTDTWVSACGMLSAKEIRDRPGVVLEVLEDLESFDIIHCCKCGGVIYERGE